MEDVWGLVLIIIIEKSVSLLFGFKLPLVEVEQTTYFVMSYYSFRRPWNE